MYDSDLVVLACSLRLVVGFGTGPGEQAFEDESDNNGCYTGALLDHLKAEGGRMPVTTLLGKVSEAVRTAAGQHGDAQTPTSVSAGDVSSIVVFETVEMWTLCEGPGLTVLHVVDPLLSRVKNQVGCRVHLCLCLFFGASIA